MPAAGARLNTSSGSLGDTQGGSAGYWSSTQNTTGTAFRLSISGGGANLMADTKAHGYIVRCVRQEIK